LESSSSSVHWDSVTAKRPMELICSASWFKPGQFKMAKFAAMTAFAKSDQPGP
jgi:hypothetical protein